MSKDVNNSICPRIFTEVVDPGYCCGCGVCAGICPEICLEMHFNRYGEYNPVMEGDCVKCGICEKVCPFLNGNANEDSIASECFSGIEGIMRRPETGYYLDSFVGFSNVDDHRVNSASGGLTTWILETLLKKNMIDYVVCVTKNDDPDKLFHFGIFDDIDSIRRSAGSAYYAVEMSSVIKRIVKSKGRYAVTGLPCFIKGLRLAARKNKKLRARLTFFIGLVCGQMKSKHYTTYLSFLAGVDGRLKTVDYRGKSPEKPASNYFFHSVDEKNSEGKLFWNEGVGEVWTSRWFTPNSCNFCDDVFAETADVTLMDAWLPEYSRDSRGTNLLISRSPIISNLLREGRQGQQVALEDVAIERVIQAQRGVLNIKRNQLAYRLYLAERNRLSALAKRVLPTRKIGFLNRKELEIKDRMQVMSKELFLKHYDNGRFDLKSFATGMAGLINDLHKWNRIGRFLSLPRRAIRKAARTFLGV